MKANFDKAILFVLSWEGDYTNDPDDPGGETRYGICKRSYPNVDIKNLTKEEAVEIYRTDYWDAMGCDDLEWPLDIIIFDTCVNMGKGAATTLKNKSTDTSDYLFNRIARYNDIASKNPKFLRGWLNRVVSLWRTIKNGK